VTLSDLNEALGIADPKLGVLNQVNKIMSAIVLFDKETSKSRRIGIPQGWYNRENQITDEILGLLEHSSGKAAGDL
jgi:hypothetical protein